MADAKIWTPVLALDLSFKNTGYAFRFPDGRISFGRKSFKEVKGKSPAYRFCMFTDFIYNSIGSRPSPELVVYEEPPYLRSRPALYAIVGLATRVEENCALFDIPCSDVPAGKIKRHATGKYKATKEEMIAAACNFFPDYDPAQDTEDGDIADALMILRYAEDNILGNNK